ncbi:MAG: 50S ribosomal protein L11 methyltransferase [Candidatus Marinimicrobia bacterium]|nr:50S ribosomal protein L11 methyltransferase [Candidatus Neomarinimicrobiota bacterium]
MTSKSTKWLCYTFPKGDYDSDILVALLSDIPCLGIDEQDDAVLAYFNASDETTIDSKTQEIIDYFPGQDLHWTKTWIENREWHLKWQSWFKPIRISPTIAVYPYWENYTGPEPVKIAIMPGMAFGTGTHPTTQMALRLLERFIQPKMKILDAGCGSGILTVAALKIGAGHVDAWDIDPNIEDNFNKHMKQNNITDRFTLSIGDVTRLNQYKYDLVLSNIERKPNLALLDNMAKYGKIPLSIFTGILKDEYAMFKRKVLNYGLIFKAEMFLDEWAAMVAE